VQTATPTPTTTPPTPTPYPVPPNVPVDPDSAFLGELAQQRWVTYNAASIEWYGRQVCTALTQPGATVDSVASTLLWQHRSDLLDPYHAHQFVELAAESYCPASHVL
jgi:hypothetical protein